MARGFVSKINDIFSTFLHPNIMHLLVEGSDYGAQRNKANFFDFVCLCVSADGSCGGGMLRCECDSGASFLCARNSAIASLLKWLHSFDFFCITCFCTP
jgi:hypothetical protein